MKDGYQFRSPSILEKEPVIYNAEEAPFSIHGLYDKKENGIFTRMPREVAERTSKKVGMLHTNTAGARLRFATDSCFIAVGAIYPPMTFSSPRSALLSGANSCCFDLYADGTIEGTMTGVSAVKDASFWGGYAYEITVDLTANDGLAPNIKIMNFDDDAADLTYVAASSLHNSK